MGKWLMRVVGLIVLVLPSVEIARAQEIVEGAATGTVSGSGEVVITKVPTVARMVIVLQEKASTAAEALSRLEDRTKAARLQLESLGARKEAIKTSSVNLGGTNDQMERQMRQMLMQQLRQGRNPETLKLAKSVTVNTTLTAEWPLEMTDETERLVFIQELTQKLEEADLAGLNEPKQLTPEEEELQEELAGMMSDYGYSGEESEPGKPVFMYSASITQEEKSQALAEAFQKAKQNAELIVTAAGASLGKLQSLEGGTQAVTDGDDYGYNVAMMRARRMMGMRGTENNDSALSSSPSEAKFQVMVVAQFDIE